MKTLLIFLTLLLHSLSYSWAADIPPGFIEKKLAGNLDPVSMTVTPDGRILIVEKHGKLRMIKNDILLSTPVLSINVDNWNERGFINILLDPKFETNNFIYLYYTHPTGYNRVSRFTMDGDFAAENSELVLFEFEKLVGPYHNGGSMAFGLDGKLYVGAGESTFRDFSQNMGTTLGKVIRINNDGSIPEDNPFYNSLQGKYRAIYAYGFRNPFAMDIDSRTGTIFINDVGESAFEEINILTAGKNYGWPLTEGFKKDYSLEIANYQDPYFVYSHEKACAITAGCMSNTTGKNFPPQYSRKYFYTDYCNGQIMYIDVETGKYEGVFASKLQRAVGVKFMPNGDMLYLQRAGIGDGSDADNTSTSEGALFKISFQGNGEPYISEQPAPISVVAGEKAIISISVSGDKPLSYSWYLNGNKTNDTSNYLTIAKADSTIQNARVYCKVTNLKGEIVSDTARIIILAGTRPTPAINFPLTTQLFKAGDTLHFSGSAFDFEDGILDSANLTWKIDMHHDAHTHPALKGFTGESGIFVIPSVLEKSPNIWFRFYLTATDKSNASQTVYRDIYPLKSLVSIKSEPHKVGFKLDELDLKTDTTIEAVAGLRRSFVALPFYHTNDSIFIFESWGAGVTNALNSFIIPARDTTLNINYKPYKTGNGSGLTGKYYNNEDDFLTDNYTKITADTNINYDWQSTRVPEGVNKDFFYAKYEGYIEPYFSGEHTFYASSDDGVKVKINDTTIIYDWNSHPVTQFIGKINLQAGQHYPIKVEYYNGGGYANLQLAWSFSSLVKEIIPERQFFPPPSILGELNNSPVNEISVYPNPFTNKLQIRIPDTEFEKIQISSSEGFVVFNLSSTERKKEITLETEELKPGIYFINIIRKNSAETRKVIKY